MHKHIITAVALLLALLIAGCTTTTDLSEQLDAQADRLAELEGQLERISESLAEMEGEQTEMEGVHTEEHTDEMTEAGPSAFDVAVAQYVLDSTGFHNIQEALEGTGEIDPTTLTTVIRASKIASSTNWPDDLAEQAEQFIEMLTEFQASLESDDVERATEISATVHDRQHDLSAAIDDWLGGEGAEHGHG